jgi:hypothetical protein
MTLNGDLVHRERGGLVSASLKELRRVFEAATTNVDKVSFTITSLPESHEDLTAVLAVARAAGHRSGAVLRRVELSARGLQVVGGSFHEIPVTDAGSGDVLRLFFERDNIDLEEAA